MTVKNAFYAQSGGVTAVINASACGVIETSGHPVARRTRRHSEAARDHDEERTGPHHQVRKKSARRETPEIIGSQGD